MTVDHFTIKAPASKSYLQRALAISAMAKGTSVLKNVTWSNDSLAAAEIVKNLGARVSEHNNNLIIQSEGLQFDKKVFNAGEAGLSIRMFSPILALSDYTITFTGEGSLLKRPMGIVVDALTRLRATVNTNNGLLPLTIKGRLKPGIIHLDGSLSSQLLTGLLMTLPLLEGNSTLWVDNLKSKPYIDMTLSVMQHFGITVTNERYRIFNIKGNQHYRAATYNIEGDWSGAAFFLVLGAVKKSVEIFNLKNDSKQADRQMVTALQKAGARVRLNKNSIIVTPDRLTSFEFDATHCPDLFPPLACLASQCKGTTILKGVSRLIHKESNRAKTIQQEFKKMGIDVALKNDMMLITGSKPIPCTIHSHSDHRIAMAGGIMNQFCNTGTINIQNPEVVNKSYPGFFDKIKGF